MSIDYNNDTKTKANLLSILLKIDSKFQDITSKENLLENTIKAIDDEQVQSDFKNVQKAQNTLKEYISSCYEEDTQARLVEKEFLREVRHDMRAAIGAIIGFGELIQDTLGSEGANKLVYVTFDEIISISRIILQTIDLLNIDNIEQDFAAVAEDEVLPYKTNLITGRILVVDDSKQKQEVFKRRLEPVGHEVSIVDNGQDALDLLEHEKVDIVLLDLIMPGMNGDKVLRKMKDNPELRDIPILVVSSSSDMENIVNCIRLGADDYLPMPVNNTLLHARINACLFKKHIRDREQSTLEQLNEARSRLSTAIESIEEGFAVFDANDRMISYNNSFREMYPSIEVLGGLGFTYEEFLRENIRQNIYQIERRKSQRADGNCLNPKEIDDWISLKLSYHKSTHKTYNLLLTSGVWIEVIENTIPGGGTVVIHKDISEGKKKEERLEYLALHDSLTGLANRKKFDTILEETFYKSHETKESFGIVFFDLDGFKQVNDTLGHDFGDFLLQTVAKKLTESVRNTDLVARLGGDEFAAIITDVKEKSELEHVAQRCLKAIGTSAERDGQQASFGVSIGISIYPDNSSELKELLQKADEAMYEAKNSGKGTYRFAS